MVKLIEGLNHRFKALEIEKLEDNELMPKHFVFRTRNAFGNGDVVFLSSEQADELAAYIVQCNGVSRQLRDVILMNKKKR